MTTSTTDRTGTVHANFAALETKARKMSRAALQYAIDDARAAADAMPEGPKAGYYADEVHVYAAELSRRSV